MELQGCRESRVIQARKVRKVHRASRGIQVLRVLRVPKVIREKKGIRGRRDLRVRTPFYLPALCRNTSILKAEFK